MTDTNTNSIPHQIDLRHYRIIGVSRNVNRDGTGDIDIDLLPLDQSKRIGPESRVFLRMDDIEAQNLMTALEGLLDLLKRQNLKQS
jgi:hypothetical protein